jgi:hypothetical protein
VEQSDDILNKWRKRFGSNRRLDGAAKSIPVYFHVIKQTNGNGGIVTDAQIAEQISVLNSSFEDAFKFTLAGNTHTENGSYYAAGIGANEESQMKSSLRQGGANALNIYTSEPYVSNEAHHVCVPLYPFSLNPRCSFLFIRRTQRWWNTGMGHLSQ